MKITLANLTTNAALELVGNANFTLVNAEDLTALSVNLSTTSNGAADGDLVTNRKAIPRTIPVILQIKNGKNVQTVINSVVSVVQPKEDVEVTWNKEDGVNPTLTIRGIVSELKKPRFGENAPAMTISFSLYCSLPYWSGATKESTKANPVSGDELTLVNDGSEPVGATFTLTATADNILLPTCYLGSQTMSFTVPNISPTLDTGDKLVVNTRRDQKSAILTLNGSDYEITPYLDFETVWITIPRGTSLFYLSSSGFTAKVAFEEAYI